MGSLVKRNNGGAELVTESETESSGSGSGSGSSCCSSTTTKSCDDTRNEEGVKKIGSCSPPLLGWPIRKAEVSKKTSVVGENGSEEKKKISSFDDSDFKKSSAIVSGLKFCCFEVMFVSVITVWSLRKFGQTGNFCLLFSF